MNDMRFDTLARFAGASSTRRGALGALAGGALLVLAGDVAADDALAKHRAHHNKQHAHRCGHGKKRCGARCIQKSACCKNGDCPAHSGQICRNGACGCSPGEEASGGVCAVKPDCLGYREPCLTGLECCSGFCATGIGGSPDAICGASIGGAPCLADTDCSRGAKCVGFVCAG